MPKSFVVKAALINRIRNSVHSLTLVFPEVRRVIPGTFAMFAAPAGLLTGALPVQEAVPTTTPVLVRSPITLKCLWLDLSTMSGARAPAVEPNPVGYVAGAQFLARVEATPAILDGLGTIFDSCDHIEKGGHQFQVLKTTPAGPSDDYPYSYYIWLGGATKQ